MREAAAALTAMALTAAVPGCGWSSRSPDILPAEASSQGRATEWWRDVGGDTLDAHVQEALRNSPTIDVLAGRVEVARADARMMSAPAQPSLNAEAARPFGERQEFETGGERGAMMRYSGSAQFAWELDFWGRVHQLRKGARKELEAAQADARAGQLLLVAEIAGLDVSRRRLAAEEAVLEEARAANDAIIVRLREKQAAGIIDANVAARQVAEGEALLREIEELRRQRQLAQLALDRLMGREPGAAEWPAAPAMHAFPGMPEVVRTELLGRRPDIQASAARVASTWHLSRAATLDLLPKLQFTGFAAGRTMRLTPSVDEWMAQVAPTLEVPVWDPERRARAAGSNARARLAAAAFREDVLRAIEETEAGLTNLAAQERILASARSAAATLHSVYQRTVEKFDSGVVSQLEVLEDQRRALEAERAALRAEEARLAAWIDVHKAMGG